MNILQEVLREHSKAMCDRVVRYVGKSPARFAEVVSVFLKGPYRVAQWAAWPLRASLKTLLFLPQPWSFSNWRRLRWSF